jgi:hypothetical protein
MAGNNKDDDYSWFPLCIYASPVFNRSAYRENFFYCKYLDENITIKICEKCSKKQQRELAF